MEKQSPKIKFYNIFAFILSFSASLTLVLPHKTHEAVWGSGYDIQASTFSVFNYQPGDPSKKLSGQVNFQIIFTFKYSFAQPPKAVAATTRYESDSSLINEQYTAFYIQKSSTETSMKLGVIITTNIFQLELRYIAINADFPYHINAYSNEVQSYKGPSSITSLTTSTFFANYSNQAKSFPFNTFTPDSNGDFSNNKILQFISCWSYKGKLQTFEGQYPPQVNVHAYAVNSSHYAIHIEVGTNAKISKLHFNMLIFDEINIQGENLHRLIYARANFTDFAGGFMPVPKQYWNATIFGFTDLSARSTNTFLFFHLYLGTLSDGSEGIIMNPPTPAGYPLNQPVQRYGITLFYLQSLICPDYGYYFNPIKKMCFQLIIEREGCNSFMITIPQCNYQKSDFNILNQVIQITEVEQNGENVVIHAKYDSSLVGQKIKIKFPSRQIIVIEYDPFLPAFYYNQNQCRAEDIIIEILYAYAGLSYFILLFSLFCGKIVGLQLFGVLQLSYFILGSYDFLNIYLYPFAKFKLFNGLNLVFTQQSSLIPKSISTMGIFSNFLNNCNIMIFSMFFFVIVCGIIIVFLKFSKKQAHFKLGINIFKQGLITFLMFNLFNLSYSFGIHFKYADSSQTLYAIGSVLLILTVLVLCCGFVVLMISSQNSIGQFKAKFKTTWVNNLFVILSFFYIIFLGLYCSLKIDYTESPLIALGISIAFLLYIMINLPFKEFYQNYRTFLIHLTQAYILLAANYYRSMKLNTPLQIKGYIFTPTIIEIVLIGLCILVSFAVLCLQVYKMIRNFREKRSVKDMSTSDNNNYNNSRHQFTVEELTLHD